jgi:hypothetical protein
MIFLYENEEINRDAHIEILIVPAMPELRSLQICFRTTTFLNP